MANPEARHEGRLVLVVDDAADTLEVIRRNLERVGFRVLTVSGVQQAIERLAEARVDLVITDLKMPGASGLTLVHHVRESARDTDVLMITGYPSVASAVEAMREGAVDYLAKPFTAAELLEAVDRAIERLDTRRSMASALGPGSDAGGGAMLVEGVLAVGHEMQQIVRAARELAPARDPVLILGEPGTGRGEIAWLLHALSGERSRNPCLRIAASRLEPGSMAAASAMEGTLVLEDIERADRDAQRHLEGILSAGASGGTGARIVATAGADLRVLAERDGYEQALASRLSRTLLEIPPLRERRDEIVPLVRHLGERAGRELGRPRPSFTETAMAALKSYPWPGNVGELWELLRTLVGGAPGRPIEPADLPERFRAVETPAEPPTRSLAEVEAAYIREVLASLEGNRSRAAEILGIDRKTLREKLRRDELASS